MTLSYNLIDEPWIPCARLDGSHVMLGLSSVVRDAHTLEGIHDPSPLVTLALHRLLLSVIHRVVDGPQDVAHWKALWTAGRLDPSVFATYFDQWRHRFDLFDPVWPFFQVGGLATIDADGTPTEPSPVARMVVEMASGNNATLFSHQRDDLSPPYPSDAVARWLVTLQASGLGGGQGPRTNLFGTHPYASHAPLAGQVSAMLVRPSLFETLILNLVTYAGDSPFARSGEDLPVWERLVVRPPGKVAPDGYLDWLTFPARYVRLRPESDGVRFAWIAPGLAVQADDVSTFNPMAFYVASTDGLRPVALREERAVWRDSGALFAAGKGDPYGRRPRALDQAAQRQIKSLLGTNPVLSIRCTGLANDKAKPLLWREETMPTAIRLLNDDDAVAAVRDAIVAAETGNDALSKAFTRLAGVCLEADGKKPDPADVGRVRTRMLAAAGYWSALDRHFLDFLRALGGDLDMALIAWKAQVLRSANAAYQRGANRVEGPLARRLHAQICGEAVLYAGLQRLKPANPLPEAARQ